MAGNAYLVCNVVVRADGREYNLGTGDLPVTIALTSGGGVDAPKFDIANGATATLWSASVGPCGSFKFLMIVSDKSDVMLEFQGAAVSSNHHFELTANVPWCIASDDSLVYNAASFTGVAEKFKKIIAKNSSGATAQVSVIVCE